jgi:hypothetical protein
MKGWVLTCRGVDGGDLRLSDVNIRRKNLVCRVMGDAIYFPMFSDDDTEFASPATSFDEDLAPPRRAPSGCIEESVLDDIRDMLMQAQRYGCWKAGIGGVGQVRSILPNARDGQASHDEISHISGQMCNTAALRSIRSFRPPWFAYLGCSQLWH